jgi:hypothetical protein
VTSVWLRAATTLRRFTNRAFILSVLAATACEGNAPSRPRLKLERDTLILYGPELTRMPVNVVDGSGNAMPVLEGKIRQSSDSILKHQGSWVSCRRVGMTPVIITVNGLSDSLMIECRAARELQPPSWLQMDLHDPAQSLAAIAVLASGDSQPVRPLYVTISDSQIVSVQHGKAFPLAVGRATLVVNYGGVQARIYVAVQETIARDALELSAGESRTWALSSGRYSITVKVSSPDDLSALRMETEGATCARASRDDDTIHCVVYDRGVVEMQNTKSSSAKRAPRAVVNIVKTP